MIRRLIGVAMLMVLGSGVAALPAAAQEFRPGHPTWSTVRDHHDYRVVTEPPLRVEIHPHRYRHPYWGYEYVWVPPQWSWTGYQWVLVPGHWAY